MKKRTTHPRPTNTTRRWLRSQTALAKKRTHAARVLSRCFGMHSQSAPPIDAVLMERLNVALQPLNFDMMEALRQRGLLSMGVFDSLNMARFLSFTLPAARAAQDITGIPSSLLIADGFQYYAGDNVFEGNDFFNTGKKFETVLDSFMHRAQMLKGDAKLRAAVSSNLDVVSFIEEHGLRECDALPILGY